MSVSPKDIAWGSYQKFEGPFFRGSLRYKLPDAVTEDARRLQVMTATESGSYDAINMYDSCILSVGLIQWCEARYYLISKLLHSVAEKGHPDLVIKPLQPALDLCCAEFKKNKNGQWRFHFTDARGEVDTLEKQQLLFLGGSGQKGTWTPINKVRAKLWAACVANIWSDPKAREIQNDYTISMLTAFMRKEGRQILWDEDVSNEGWPGATRAAFLTFALNNPARANKHIQIAVAKLKSPKWSPTWCIGVVQELTFGPKIAIYPYRYKAILPWLGHLWEGVEFPKDIDALRNWQEPQGVLTGLADSAIAPASETEPITIKSPLISDAVEPLIDDNSKSSLVLRASAVPIIEPNAITPQGTLGWLLNILHMIMNFFLRGKTLKK